MAVGASGGSALAAPISGAPGYRSVKAVRQAPLRSKGIINSDLVQQSQERGALSDTFHFRDCGLTARHN